MEIIVDKLKKNSTGMLAASELGGDINRVVAWSSVIKKARGLKLFCLDHADKIKWISKKQRQFHWGPHPRIATPWGAE